MSSIRLTTRMKEEIARNALIKSGVFTELEEVTKLRTSLHLTPELLRLAVKRKLRKWISYHPS